MVFRYLVVIGSLVLWAGLALGSGYTLSPQSITEDLEGVTTKVCNQNWIFTNTGSNYIKVLSIEKFVTHAGNFQIEVDVKIKSHLC